MVKLIPLVKNPRYDDVYHKGVEAMRDDSECYDEAELLKPDPSDESASVIMQNAVIKQHKIKEPR